MPLARAKLTEVFVAGVEPGPGSVLIRGVRYGAVVGGGLGAAFVVVSALVSIMGGGVVPDLDLLVLVLIVGATVGAVAGPRVLESASSPTAVRNLDNVDSTCFRCAQTA